MSRDEHRARRDHRGPFKKTGVFPPMVSQMIGVGEATGAASTHARQDRRFYEEEVDRAVAGLLTLLRARDDRLPGRRRRRIVFALMYLPIFSLISKADVRREEGMTDDARPPPARCS